MGQKPSSMMSDDSESLPSLNVEYPYPEPEQEIQISSSIVMRDFTRRGDLFGFNKQHDDRLVMIVSPNCVCYLVNIDKREVYWKFEDKNEKLYESFRNEGVDDYLDVEVDEHGKMQIYRYNSLSNSEMKLCNLITPYVKARDIYGEDLAVTKSINTLDFQHLHIERKDYKFSMQHKWHLKCSIYTTSFKDSGVTCFVYHALTQDAFIDICGKFKISKSVENMSFIQKFTQGKRIKICDPMEIVYGDLVKGTFDEEYDVAVQILEQGDDDMSTIYANNAWSTYDGGKHVTRLIKAEIQDGRCLLAFQPCLMTFRQYLEHHRRRNDLYGHVDIEWLCLFRGLLRGIRDLHKHSGRCHGDLNTGNILISTDGLTTKLSGFSRSMRFSNNRELAKESRSNDMYALGKVLLFWYSGLEFDDLTSTADPLTYLPSIHPFTQEGYEIVKKLLDPSPARRPDIDEVIIDPFVWHPNQRLAYVEEVGAQLETTDGINLLEAPIESILKEVLPPRPAGTSSTDPQEWSSSFSDDFMTEMVNYNTNDGRPYDKFTVASLLRFMRDIIDHRVRLSKTQREVVGEDRFSLECTFRHKFPKLLIKVHTVVKDVLKDHPGIFPSLEAYYEVDNYLTGYFTCI